MGFHVVCWVNRGVRAGCGSDVSGVRGRSGRRQRTVGVDTLSLALWTLRRGRLLASGGRGLVDDLDGVRALALADGAEVAEADGMLNRELARDVSDVEPLGEVIDGDKRDDCARDAVDAAIGGVPLGARSDDEKTRAGCHNADHGKC